MMRRQTNTPAVERDELIDNIGIALGMDRAPSCVFSSLAPSGDVTDTRGLGINAGDTYRKCYEGILQHLSSTNISSGVPGDDGDDGVGEQTFLLPSDFDNAMLEPIRRLVPAVWHQIPSTLIAWNARPTLEPQNDSTNYASPFVDDDTEFVDSARPFVTLRKAERSYRRNPKIIEARKYASPEASYQLHLKQTMSDFVTNEMIGENKI